jgi:PAS domain S-box-containing protein
VSNKYKEGATGWTNDSAQYDTLDPVDDDIPKAIADRLSAKAFLATRAANIGIWEYVFERNQLIADDIVLSHFGITGAGYNGTYDTLWDCIHPDDKAGLAKDYKNAVAARVDLDCKCRIPWKDGTLHYIKVNGAFQWDEDGNPRSLIGSCQDITCSKKAELSLLESENKFRTFYENNPDALLLTETDGKILAANPAAVKIFQMTEAEICRAGRFGLVDPSDARVEILIEERARNGRAKGEVTFMRKDGTRFPGEITSIVFVSASGGKRTSMMIRDLSEVRNAEEKLRAASNSLQQALNGLNKIMDSSLDMICTVDDQGRFGSMSSASARILGYAPQELLNVPFIDLVLKDDVDRTVKVDRKVRDGEAVNMFENRYVHKDGSIITLLWSARWDHNDQLAYCIARDVSETKVLEKALQMQRQRFLDLHAQAPSCMGILKGPDHIFEMANPRYLKLIGKTDIIGKKAKELFPELESQGLFAAVDHVYATGETFSANEMLVRIDFSGTGQLKDTYLNFIYQAHRDIENNIDGIHFFVIDVTEQVLSRRKIEESEKKYRQIVETANEGIWLIDENNRTTFVNNKLCEILEYSEAEIMGREIFDFMDEEGRELAADMMLEKRAGRSGQKNFKYIAKSGKEIWVNLSANPLFNADNSYKGALAMVTDITDRIALERQLINEQINKQKEITIAAVNAQEKERREIGEELHDNVNQILATAKLFLSRALTAPDGHKPFIIKSQGYLTAAIAEIRKLTKALVGPTEANDMGLIASVKELIGDILLAADIRIEFTHDTYCEDECEDALKIVIYRIIQEQLNNVLKHSGATHVVIAIKPENGSLHLLISDNGRGFDTTLPRAGIGLQNIKHRAGLYNGEVSIRTSPGNGCTVSIIFQPQ